MKKCRAPDALNSKLDLTRLAALSLPRKVRKDISTPPKCQRPKMLAENTVGASASVCHNTRERKESTDENKILAYDLERMSMAMEDKPNLKPPNLPPKRTYEAER